MKLKPGDIVLEEDGIVTLVYKIIEVKGRKAIGESRFEGTRYLTAYKAKYTQKDRIRPFIEQKGIKDLTIRRLAGENEQHLTES